VSGICRIIVGTSGSPGSLGALRYAEDLARAHDAALIPVLTWVPPGGDRPDRLQPPGYLRHEWQDAACRRLRDALIAAWGQVPDDPSIQPVVQRGEAGRVLLRIASRPDDLLVVGAGRRGGPVRARVAAELPGRPPPPVESAAYFAVSELLANVSKHAAAGQVWIDIRHDAGVLRLGVTDDGAGGADPARGTGVRGIERRIAAFDGVLAVSSPPGGPTVVNMEIPCTLSSPKISCC